MVVVVASERSDEGCIDSSCAAQHLVCGDERHDGDGCDANDLDCIDRIDGVDEQNEGEGDCQREQQGSIACIGPVDAPRSSTSESDGASDVSFSVTFTAERRGEGITTYVNASPGRPLCTSDVPMPTCFLDTSQESTLISALHQTEVEFFHNADLADTQSARHIVSEGMDLVESASGDIPKVVQGDGDEDLEKAAVLLTHVAEADLSASSFTCNPPSRSGSRSCIEGMDEDNELKEVPALDRIVTILERLGDMCGQLESLSGRCQELLKAEVPRAIVCVLRKLSCMKRRQWQVTADDKRNHAQAASQEQRVYLQSCYVLANLSFESDSETRSAIASTGGVDALLTAMRMHPDDELIQMFSCGTLGNLLIDNESNAQLVDRSGGIEVIVAAMETHRCSEHLQEWALRALNNMCHYEALRPNVVNAGGFHVMQEAVRMVSRPPCHVGTTESTVSRTWAIDALSETVALLEQ